MGRMSRQIIFPHDSRIMCSFKVDLKRASSVGGSLLSADGLADNFAPSVVLTKIERLFLEEMISFCP